jgi:hypothetical protein
MAAMRKSRFAEEQIAYAMRLPAVTQVTYLVVGKLTVRMKDMSAVEPYDLALQAG